MHKVITFDSFIRTMAVIAGVVLVILAINYLSAVLIPFFVAWFVAYLIFPIVEFFQYKLHFRFRVLAILATMLLLGGIGTLLVWLTIPPVVEDFNRFTDIVEHYIQSKSHHSNIEHFIARYIGDINLPKLLRNGEFLDIARSVMPGMWNVLQHTAGIIMSIIAWSISVLYMFFILYDYDRITHGWRKLIPRRYLRFAETLFTDLKNGMNAYFRGQVIISFCVGVLFCIGFTIIDFPLAIPMGILIGMLSFIPYLHALGLVPAFFLCILKSAETGDSFWMVALSAAAVFIVVQAIQDIILTPKIMGKAIGLPPYLILLSLSVWGFLLGIIGMIIALPLTTIIFSYYKRYISKTE